MLSNKTRIPESSCVLVSKLNPETRRVWWPRPSGTGTPVCSPEFVVLVPNDDVPHAFLVSALRCDPLVWEHIVAHASGTTGSRQRVAPADVLRAPLPLLSQEDAEVAAYLETMLVREALLIEECRTLLATRNALLPRLLGRASRGVEIGQDLSTAVA